MKCFLRVVSCAILGLSFVDFTDAIRPANPFPNPDPDIIEGDIQANHESREMMRQGINKEDYPFSLWRNEKNITDRRTRPVAVVPFVIGKYDQQDKDKIMSAITMWNSKLKDCIFWKMLKTINETTKKLITECPSDEHCVTIKAESGCSSKIGRNFDSKNKPEAQIMSLTQKCLYSNDPKITVLHEMEHNIGMDHEHVRYDRDEHIEIDKEATKSYESEFVIPPKGQRILIGPYDVYSIMHYNLQDAKFFKVLDPDIDLNRVGRGEENGTTFTKLDIYKIRTLYGCAKAILPSN